MKYYVMTILGSKISFTFNSLEEIIDFFRHFDVNFFKEYFNSDKLTFVLFVLYPFKVQDGKNKSLSIGQRFYSYVTYSRSNDIVSFDISLPF